MRQLRIINVIAGRKEGEWEVELADGPKHIAVYCEGGRYAVSRLEGKDWRTVAEHTSDASIEAWLPPNWTFNKLMILLDGYEQGNIHSMQRFMARAPQARHTEPPPKPPLRIRARLAWEKVRALLPRGKAMTGEISPDQPWRRA